MSISAKGQQQAEADSHTSPAPGAEDRTPVSGVGASPHGIFRNFSPGNFCETDSWLHLADILQANAGCYGLYGPRGSGKTWLMLRAIHRSEEEGGLGLWFPCPSEYLADDFLSALSDNLANAVERRFARATALASGIRRGRGALIALVAVAVILAGILYGIRGVTLQNKASGKAAPASASIFPVWLWALVAAACVLAIVATIAVFCYENFSKGNLVNEATALRERIRFTQSLKLGADIRVSGGKGFIGALSRSRERTLNERTTSVATLIFDFRHLTEHIVSTLNGKPFIVCIDELDKIDDPKAVRSLLRDIKGIFEIHGMTFLVSISEEAAASLQIGILQNGGRNELNSSFYAVVGLPPLTPGEAETLLLQRGLGHEGQLANALCLLAGGNRRELIRMAHSCNAYSRRHRVPLDEWTIIGLLEDESQSLLQEISRDLPVNPAGMPDDDIKYRAWMALPRDAFYSQDSFIRFGQSAIRDYWEPRWANDEWNSVSESWKRLLIRLFVSARVLTSGNARSKESLLHDESVVTVLRDILLMATQDSAVARLMLWGRFGDDLLERFRSTPPRSAR